MAESHRVTGRAERGLLHLSRPTSRPSSRERDFLACRHYVEACQRQHVVCHHHSAASQGAVRMDSALFVCLEPRPALVLPEGRR